MATKYGTVLVRAGRYVSADGEYVIQRERLRKAGRARSVIVTRWHVGRWSSGRREFIFDGTYFRTLNAARQYVGNQLSERLF